MSFITIITSFFTILIVKLFTRLISLEKNSKREFRYQDNVYLYTLKTFPRENLNYLDFQVYKLDYNYFDI